MALDHSRLGLENKSGQFFAIGKFTLQNLANKSGGMQTSLLYFLYITSGVKQYYEVLFLSYSTLDRMQYFTILQDKLHSFNIQDDRSTHGLLAKPFTKKVSKSPIMASRFSFLTSTKFAVQAVKCLNEH